STARSASSPGRKAGSKRGWHVECSDGPGRRPPMNMPPSLDDDDGEVILDDLVIEEYEPRPIGEEGQSTSPEGGEPMAAESEKPPGTPLLRIGLLALVTMTGIAVAMLAMLRPKPRRWLPRFARH